jgi:hypothetical protein
VTRVGVDWHGLGYRPTPPIATTEMSLRIRGRVVERWTVNEDAVRFPFSPNRVQVLRLSQATEPGTLKALITVDFDPGTTHCAPYMPPGLRVMLLPR